MNDAHATCQVHWGSTTKPFWVSAVELCVSAVAVLWDCQEGAIPPWHCFHVNTKAVLGAVLHLAFHHGITSVASLKLCWDLMADMLVMYQQQG